MYHHESLFNELFIVRGAQHEYLLGKMLSAELLKRNFPVNLKGMPRHRLIHPSKQCIVLIFAKNNKQKVSDQTASLSGIFCLH